MAAYVHADIVVKVLLSEITELPDLSLMKCLASKQPRLLRLELMQLIQSYCVIAYRNKIVSHHEEFRIGTRAHTDDLRITSFSPGLLMDQEVRMAMLILKAKYDATIAGLKSETNDYRILNLLFYGIPIGTIGGVSADRKKIDGLAERGGCQSLSVKEVIGAIDQLLQEVGRSAA